jgi:competence protein ComEC
VINRRSEKEARITKRSLTIFLVALLIFALVNLLELSDLFPSNEAANIHTRGQYVEVHFIDVGQGDSIYIKTPAQDILIDGGDRGSAALDYLLSQNVKDLELVIGTHPHADHIGGLIEVLETIPVREVMDPGVVHTSKTFEDYLVLIDEKDIDFTAARAGMKRTFEDGTVLEILSPDSPSEDDLNNASIVARLTYGKVSFLFTGDAEIPSENAMLDAMSPLRSTILKAGHHGSSTSTVDAFLEAVSPEAVVIMCGADNSYGHPHREVLEKLEDADIKVFRTDIHGTIIVSTDGKSYGISYDKSVEPN